MIQRQDQKETIAAPKSQNLYHVDHRVTRQQRQEHSGHASGILWLTGLSGSGKTTLAFELEHRLHQRGYNVYTLDGDNVRGGLNRDLGFSHQDRTENIRRIGEVAGLFVEAGTIVITAFISPYRADRHLARAVVPDLFHEIYIKAGLEICEQRDPKGLYKRARSGEIAEFTGISAPYEVPKNAEFVVDTEQLSVSYATAALIDYVERHFGVPKTFSHVA